VPLTVKTDVISPFSQPLLTSLLQSNNIHSFQYPHY